MKPITFTIPLKTVSGSNVREHWAVRAKRVKQERRTTMLKCPPWNGGPLLVITLTRISPRMLDRGDNLPISLKGVRDSLAAKLRIDDATPLVEWKYAQEKGEPAVRVGIRPTWAWLNLKNLDDREVPDSSPSWSPKKVKG